MVLDNEKLQRTLSKNGLNISQGGDSNEDISFISSSSADIIRKPRDTVKSTSHSSSTDLIQPDKKHFIE
jgi:hypothetical protein